MPHTELAFTPAGVQAGMVRRREVSPVELVGAYLDRIDRLNPRLGAYLTVAADRALDDARRAEAALGEHDLPPFHGVPVAVKDLTDTAGIRTTHGTAAWSNRVPDADAESVTRLKRAGFVVLGKTNTPEFGSAPVTESPGYPPARNPWDTQRTPGGSSGGAGAAVAAGLCPVAHGSDAGGSIRIPSALCGVFGIKPSRGRVSAAPRPPAFLAQQGPIARTVADAAGLLDALAGYAVGDPWWAPPPTRPFAEEVGVDPGRLRIALATDPFLPGVDVAPGNKVAAERAGVLLESLGHVVEEAAPAWDPGAVGQEAATVGAELASRLDELPPVETLDPVNRFIIEIGSALPAAALVAAQTALLDEVRRVVAFFDRYDLLLTPTVPIPPPPVGEYTSVGEREDLREYLAASMVGGDAPRFAWLAAFTSPWNVTGQPAVSVPFGFDEHGLPTGVQLVGPPADEATLVRVAAQMERARPWADRRPPAS